MKALAIDVRLEFANWIPVPLGLTRTRPTAAADLQMLTARADGVVLMATKEVRKNPRARAAVVDLMELGAPIIGSLPNETALEPLLNETVAAFSDWR